jgi:hypothetical protein
MYEVVKGTSLRPRESSFPKKRKKEYIRATDNNEIRRFSVREHPRIVVNNDFGSIHVRGEGQRNEVIIQETQRNWILIGESASPAQIHYEQNNDDNSILVTVERSGWSVTEIILNITVPWNTDLNLTTKAGSMDVTTLSGQMSLPSNTAFHVDARTDIGSITTNMPGVVVTRLNYMNSEARGDVGNPPRAMVTLRSNLGSIYLQEGKVT